MLRFSTSVNFLFTEVPFLDRFRAAREAGITGVEIQFMEAPAMEVAKAVQDAGVEVVLINADMGDLLSGGPGLSGVPGREADFERAVAEAAETAELLGSHFVHLGPSGIPEGATREQCLGIYRGNVEKALQLDSFASGRVGALLEPVNATDMPGVLFTDIDEAASLVANEFGGTLGLQFDIYHIEKGGKSALAKWQQYANEVSHVQFSDVPERNEPGTGSVAFEEVFAAIRESNYSGWVGAEYFPSKSTVETLSWLGYATSSA